MGQVFGLPWRIFLAVLGVLVSVLTVTGIIIWWKKRAARAVRPVSAAMPARGTGGSLPGHRG
jgi:uncharacterized iron-regulated membrane protein